MKSVTSLVGILLILLGVGSLAYQGFSYTQREKVAQIGNVEVTADKEKTIYFSPFLGGIALVGGIVLVALSRK